MSLVFAATDLVLDTQVAIKFLVHSEQDEGMLARFHAEVTLSRLLDHPNVIRLYDIGTHDDIKYITMELLRGKDLDQEIGDGSIPLQRGIGLLIQACAGLQAVHDRGVIHRDIKPANFFVTDYGSVKVMDFGIAKRRNVHGLSVDGMMAGTPHFISPEQINDFSNVSHLTDLYSLGCVAYQMFTGGLPFDHAELLPLLVMHLNDAPQPPREREPSVPAALDTVILQLLSKRASDRIQSCRELADRLRAIAASLPPD
jgi:serine/threonine-protein kinase